MVDTVAQILSRKGRYIWSIAPYATVYDAIALMAEKRIGAVLVALDTMLVGILSERDYARKVILQGRSSKDTAVREIMTTLLVTVSPDHTVEACMRIMTQNWIRHLPVVARGQLVGVVSISDLVNAVVADQADAIDQLQAYISHRYPA
jgi:CBS domain-containing protein